MNSIFENIVKQLPKTGEAIDVIKLNLQEHVYVFN